MECLRMVYDIFPDGQKFFISKILKKKKMFFLCTPPESSIHFNNVLFFNFNFIF